MHALMHSADKVRSMDYRDLACFVYVSVHNVSIASSFFMHLIEMKQTKINIFSQDVIVAILIKMFISSSSLNN